MMNIFCWNKEKSLPELLSKSSLTLHKLPMSKNFGKILSLALGAGVVVSATGIILYHYLYGQQYILVLERDLRKLSLSLADLRREFEELRGNKKIGNKKPESRRNSIRDVESKVFQKKQNPVGSASSFLTTNTDGAGSMYSAVETDDEDEFCDISDSSSTTGPEEEGENKNRKKFPRRFIMSITPPTVSAATLNNVDAKDAVDYDKIDKLLEGNDEQKLSAYNTLLQANKKEPDDWKILWRLARACHIVGTIEGTKGNQKGKQQYITQGVEYATRALELNKNDAKVHKWYAICIGARGKFLSTKEKIQDGYVYKEHVEKAIKIDPQDPTLYNLLGRFELEVSSLSTMERKVASWLFSEVPKGSIAEAIRNFKKAEKLNKKPWKENRLLLAKCYINQSEYSDALEWLDKASEVPVVTSEEREFQAEIEKLLSKYNYYRDSK